MRNTKQRKIILNIVKNTFCHPTAEEVYKEARKVLPDISLGTVYRNLNLLVNLNEIKRIKTSDGTDRFDKLDNKHIHFICSECGKIYDIFEYEFNENIISLKNFEIRSYDIVLSGICDDCKKGR